LSRLSVNEVREEDLTLVVGSVWVEEASNPVFMTGEIEVQSNHEAAAVDRLLVQLRPDLLVLLVQKLFLNVAGPSFGPSVSPTSCARAQAETWTFFQLRA
jgi:hypothetical protein